MKRICSILLLNIVFLLPTGAERLTMTFKDVPLTKALIEIEESQNTYHIHFVFNELEGYRVSTRINQLHPKDAVLAVCESLPVKVWGKGKNIFVESLERPKEEIPETGFPDSLAPEKTMVLREIDVIPSPPICVKKAGSLSSILTQEQQDTLTMLTLSGKLNSDDIRTLRHMAGYKEEGYRTGRLKYLNLREAELMTDRRPYLVLDPKEENMMGFAIGKYFDPNGRHTTYKSYFVLDCPPSNNKRAAQRVELKDLKSKNIIYLSLDMTPISKISFDFRFPFSKLMRTWLRRCEMHKFDGHRMKWNGKEYKYFASMRKGIFFLDMFYKCPHMESIVLPEHAKISLQVSVKDDSIIYIKIKSHPEETIRGRNTDMIPKLYTQ